MCTSIFLFEGTLLTLMSPNRSIGRTLSRLAGTLLCSNEMLQSPIRSLLLLSKFVLCLARRTKGGRHTSNDLIRSRSGNARIEECLTVLGNRDQSCSKKPIGLLKPLIEKILVELLARLSCALDLPGKMINGSCHPICGGSEIVFSCCDEDVHYFPCRRQNSAMASS